MYVLLAVSSSKYTCIQKLHIVHVQSCTITMIIKLKIPLWIHTMFTQVQDKVLLLFIEYQEVIIRVSSTGISHFI